MNERTSTGGWQPAKAASRKTKNASLIHRTSFQTELRWQRSIWICFCRSNMAYTRLRTRRRKRWFRTGSRWSTKKLQINELRQKRESEIRLTDEESNQFTEYEQAYYELKRVNESTVMYLKRISELEKWLIENSKSLKTIKLLETWPPQGPKSSFCDFSSEALQ